MSARDHNNLIGILIMVRGALLLVGGLLMGIFMSGGGLLMMNAGHRHDDHVAGGVMMAGGIIGGIVMVLGGFFDIYAGIKIRKVAPSGRTLGIIVCILSLFSFPLGTALGVYGIWFFFGDMGRALYLGGPGAPAADFDRNAPPPNSWA